MIGITVLFMVSFLLHAVFFYYGVRALSSLIMQVDLLTQKHNKLVVTLMSVGIANPTSPLGEKRETIQ